MDYGYIYLLINSIRELCNVDYLENLDIDRILDFLDSLENEVIKEQIK